MAKDNCSDGAVVYKTLDFLGFPNYRVGTDGSGWRWHKDKRRWVRLKLYPQPKKGYRQFQLMKNGIRKVFSVHRAVLLAFVGPCPEGMECCHENGNGSDNRLKNLSWGTRVKNQADRIRHGTDSCGERGSGVKLNIEQVHELRALYATGEYSQRMLADWYECTKTNVGNIVRRKTWKHI